MKGGKQESQVCRLLSKIFGHIHRKLRAIPLTIRLLGYYTVAPKSLAYLKRSSRSLIFWISKNFKSTKNNWVCKSQIWKLQKYIVRKSQIHKMSHLRKICNSKQKFKSTNLLICDLRSLFANRPRLNICDFP
jgi:hypothetical protein